MDAAAQPPSATFNQSIHDSRGSAGARHGAQPHGRVTEEACDLPTLSRRISGSISSIGHPFSLMLPLPALQYATATAERCSHRTRARTHTHGSAPCPGRTAPQTYYTRLAGEVTGAGGHRCRSCPLPPHAAQPPPFSLPQPSIAVHRVDTARRPQAVQAAGSGACKGRGLREAGVPCAQRPARPRSPAWWRRCMAGGGRGSERRTMTTVPTTATNTLMENYEGH